MGRLNHPNEPQSPDRDYRQMLSLDKKFVKQSSAKNKFEKLQELNQILSQPVPLEHPFSIEDQGKVSVFRPESSENFYANTLKSNHVIFQQHEPHPGSVGTKVLSGTMGFSGQAIKQGSSSVSKKNTGSISPGKRSKQKGSKSASAVSSRKKS